MSISRLSKEYKDYIKDPSPYYSLCPTQESFFIWDVLLFGPAETIFEGGIFKAVIEFPPDYPHKPLHFKFVDYLPHPNIYKDGRVCISILHDGNDEFQYESINERWCPSQTVDSVLLSIISLLIQPNFESSANIDITLMWKNEFNNYKKLLYNIIRCSSKVT